MGNTRSIPLLALGLLLACTPLDRLAAQDKTPTLRRGSAWSEEAAKRKLEEYGKTWSDRTSWEKRAAAIREGILRGSGLAPLPPKTALNPILRGERRHDGYTVQNVAFESLPGFFVTGNLYRPTSPPAIGRSPGILATHGHCTGITTPFGVNKTGGRFGGETQRICAVMARMGAVVFAYDMTGVNEAQQYPHTGPMAMTVQLWDSIRAVDFLCSLPQVDPARIGITGASGGGTQSFLLAAVDERVKVSIPTVQVSAYFFGGCICESGMPIHVSDRHDTCNAEIAALHAPKPMLVISDGKDWTKNTPLVEFPYIQSVYRAYAAQNTVENLHLPLEGHDYGPSKRQGAYAFFAKHLGLRKETVPHADGKIDESFVAPETYEVLCVFDDAHPRPAGALKDPAAVEVWLRGTRSPQGERSDMSPASAREIHVSKTGNDSASGSEAHAYLTIDKAASVAQPGDTVIVHAGTYREWVKPARGGTDEGNRITYRAAPGEEVLVKGSERITSWKPEAGGVWKVELPNSVFDPCNPYALQVSGGWLDYGQWHHRGDVYLKGEAFYEKKTAQEVTAAERTWSCQADKDMTTIRANFGKANPNTELAEINVRESIFMPEITGLKYITIDGFHFAHAAANWAPPNLKLQLGAVGTRMGKYWIIENCEVTNARCVGIILGHALGVDYRDIDAFGDHIIRNNVIRRCGQAGIAGQKGATRCLISGNFIEDTNYRKEFGGWETAAIKFHNSVDTVISGNLIRGVYRQMEGAFGIWMDFGNQGTRITRNIIYKTEAATIFLEMDHGPTLVDNNVLIGPAVRSNSEATVFAHNLFVDCGYDYSPDTGRRSEYYKPHTTQMAGRKTGTAQDDRWFNNIFVRQGLDRVKTAPGYTSEYNAFLEGAKKSSFGDAKSVVDSYVTGLTVKDHPRGATITFSVNDAPFQAKGPQVNAELVGVFPTVGQTIEDRYGKPITVDADLNGRTFAPPVCGPLADLKSGINTIVWPIKQAQ
jgi:dienelactone hydrolase